MAPVEEPLAEVPSEDEPGGVIVVVVSAVVVCDMILDCFIPWLAVDDILLIVVCMLLVGCGV